MGRLVVSFVVVDAEGIIALLRPPVAPAPATCGGKKRAATDDMTTKADRLWIVGHIRAQSEAGNLGVVPVDGERDGRVAEHAEVEGVVGVLPDVLAADDEVFAEGLLEAGMKLVAEAGLKCPGYAGGAEQAAEPALDSSIPGWRARGSR